MRGRFWRFIGGVVILHLVIMLVFVARARADQACDTLGLQVARLTGGHIVLNGNIIRNFAVGMAVVTIACSDRVGPEIAVSVPNTAPDEAFFEIAARASQAMAKAPSGSVILAVKACLSKMRFSTYIEVQSLQVGCRTTENETNAYFRRGPNNTPFIGL